jgi:transcriptional repressor NrdR
MKCPFCSNDNSYVKDSRLIDAGKVVRRRRLCEKCKAKFTTFEKVQLRDLFVIKRSGLRKKFDRDKIVKAIMTATRTREVLEDKINKIADDILQEVEGSASGEISTYKIGEMIMKALAPIDQVAYIRFASVYKDFASTVDFAKFINRISGDKK